MGSMRGVKRDKGDLGKVRGSRLGDDKRSMGGESEKEMVRGVGKWSK